MMTNTNKGARLSNTYRAGTTIPVPATGTRGRLDGFTPSGSHALVTVDGETVRIPLRAFLSLWRAR